MIDKLAMKIWITRATKWQFYRKQLEYVWTPLDLNRTLNYEICITYVWVFAKQGKS